jgi:predicted RND superfamily exporter protein
MHQHRDHPPKKLRTLPVDVADWIAHLVVNRPRRLIGAAILLLVLCIWVVSTRPRLDSEVLNLLPSQAEPVEALKVFQTELRQGRELIFAVNGDPDTVAEFEEHFIEELRSQPWVERIFTGSPMESPEEISALQAMVPQLLLNLDDASFAAALDSLTPQALQERVRRLRTNLESGSPRAEMEATVDPLGIVGQALKPLAVSGGMEKGQVLGSTDGSMKLYPVVTKQQSLGQAECKALMQQVDEFRARVRTGWGRPAPDVLVTGRAAYVAQIAGSMERDVTITSLVSVIAVTGLFLIAFRRLIPPLATSLILSFTCFVAFAAGCSIFDDLNMIAIAFCSILLGLGDDFSLLLYNRYLLARLHAQKHEQAISTAISEMGPGILWVALTTGVGFLALGFSGSSGFAQLGTLIAIGIVLCALFVITLLFLFIRPTHAHPERPDPLARFFDAFAKRLLKTPKRISTAMMGVALLVVTSAALTEQPLQFDTNPRSLEPKEIPASRALQLINDKVPSLSEPVILLVDAPDAETAHQRWGVLEGKLRELVASGTLESFSTPAALMLSPERLANHRKQLLERVDLAASRDAYSAALEKEGFKPDAFAAGFELLDQLGAAAASSSDRLVPEGLLPSDSSWWFLLDRYLGTKPFLATAYLRPATSLASRPEQVALEEAIRATGVPAKVTGWGYSMVAIVPWAKQELVFFSLAVGGLVLACLASAYRHWKPLVVHVFTLAIAFIVCLALLKLTQTKLNLLNALAFPLVLGVGVDYGMHLLLAVREEETPEESLLTVLKPLVISGLTTISGFGALMFAQNPALKGLGIVCAIGVASCLASSILFGVPLMAALSGDRRSGADVSL